MPKSNAEKMKRDEIKVLDVLEQHAKESIDELAKRCDFSRQKIWKIIKNLEKNKIIWGYSAVTGPEEKDSKHFVLLLKRSMVPLDASMKREVITEKLDDHSPNMVKIENIYLTHGLYDGIITFYAPDIITAKMMVQEIFQRIGKYFKEYLLLETLFPIRKNGLKNPQMKNLVEYI